MWLFLYYSTFKSECQLRYIPLLQTISILVDADIEHGLHQRFPEGTEVPPFMAIAASGRPENAYEVGKIVAKESRAVGIHWNFSPVVDVLVETQSMSEAVKIAHKLANKKDYVLLSPACASFDLFKNYEDRGNQFKEAVRNL